MAAAMTAPAFVVPDWSRLAKEGAHEGAKARFQLRAGLRDVTTSDRRARCGVSPIVGHDDCPHLTLTSRGDGETGYRAKWRGVLFCGSIWCCPVCSAKKRAVRALAVEDALRTWGETPGATRLAQMATLTVAHLGYMRMSHVFAVLRAAWRKFRQGGRVQEIMGGVAHFEDGCVGRCKHRSRIVERVGGKVKGSIRAFEVTRKGDAHGFHPHIHCLWLHEQLLDAAERQTMVTRWIECVRSIDPACAPSEEHAVVWSDP